MNYLRVRARGCSCSAVPRLQAVAQGSVVEHGRSSARGRFTTAADALRTLCVLLMSCERAVQSDKLLSPSC